MGVKKKTTLADPKFVISESSLSLEFNTILEETKGVAKEKEFSYCIFSWKRNNETHL